MCSSDQLFKLSVLELSRFYCITTYHLNFEINVPYSEPEQELTEEQRHFRRSISRALSHESKELVDDDKDEEDKDDEDFIKESKEKGKFVDDEEVEMGKVRQ